MFFDVHRLVSQFEKIRVLEVKEVLFIPMYAALSQDLKMEVIHWVLFPKNQLAKRIHHFILHGNVLCASFVSYGDSLSNIFHRFFFCFRNWAALGFSRWLLSDRTFKTNFFFWVWRRRFIGRTWFAIFISMEISFRWLNMMSIFEQFWWIWLLFVRWLTIRSSFFSVFAIGR